MPFLIAESHFGESASGPGGGHGDVGNRLETFSPHCDVTPLDQGEIASKRAHVTGVGSGSDAGNSSGTEPSTTTYPSTSAWRSTSTTTTPSDLTSGNSGGSSSASDNDAESAPFKPP